MIRSQRPHSERVGIGILVETLPPLTAALVIGFPSPSLNGATKTGLSADPPEARTSNVIENNVKEAPWKASRLAAGSRET